MTTLGCKETRKHGLTIIIPYKSKWHSMRENKIRTVNKFNINFIICTYTNSLSLDTVFYTSIRLKYTKKEQ